MEKIVLENNIFWKLRFLLATDYIVRPFVFYCYDGFEALIEANMAQLICF